jgi:ATP-binding cassette subfamily F protein uup
MGRLQALVALRQRRAEYLAPQGGVGLATDSGALSGKLVIEAKQISKALGGRTLVEAFSTRIMRGDRVGIIGANGAGKTTLLRLLTGTLPPDQGTVRLGANLQLAMVDQQRAALDPDATLWHSLTDGAGDSITVRGTPRHVMGYLRDFNFEDRQAHSPVRSLSGGERNRLLLAKLLAKPANLLVLDEPTNDLDMDTLDLLEDTLADFDGTLLLVSHDRDFLDRLVSSVLWVEGDGRVREYVGGYSEALRQRSRAPESGGRGAGAKALPKPLPQTEPSSRRAKAVAARLTYKDQRELEQLPAHLDRLAAEITRLEGQLSDPSLYAGDSAGVVRLGARLAQLQAEQGQAEERWLALELQREQGGG